MRRCAILLLVAMMAPLAFAAKRVTVDQLDKTLLGLQGKLDTEIAKRLRDMELTERPSQPTLSRWQTDFSGTETQQALALLSNAAAFLDLPPSEIPATPPPDREAQRKMLALTVDYVSKTIHQLPNLFATRDTTHFEDTPQGYEKGGMVFVPAQPMHFVGVSSATIVYRDGAEVLNSNSTKAGAPKAPQTDAMLHGLTTSGEFGPMLVTILIDAAHGTLGWSHWEPTTSGPLAVFRYAVLREKSHYRVGYCCVPNSDNLSSGLQPFHQISGYHGEIAVDPETGTILRLTAQADLKATDPLVRADIMVEYGSVEIGGHSYICPLKSVSISVGHALQAAEMQHLRISSEVESLQYEPGHMQTLLNEVTFSQYHLFHADTRILAADAGPPAGTPATSTSSKSAGDASPSTSSPSQPNQPETSAPAAAAANDAPVAPTPPPANPATETAATAPISEPPAAQPAAEPDFDVPSLSTRAQGQVPVFKASSEAVVVDVVVTKGRDEPVTGLRKEDFQIAEDGKPQSANYFEEHAPDNAPADPLPQMPPNVFTNQPAAPPGDSVNVLLLDSLNTDREDQSFVHQQILNYLKSAEPGTPIAIFTLSSKLRMVQGFTTDSSVLQASLNDPKSGAATTTTSMSRSLQDKLDDQDEIANLSAAQMSPIGIQAVQASQANHATYQADQRVKMTLEAMDLIARYLAGIPGRKNLIWFSGSFPISVFPNAKERQSSDTMRQYGPAIRQTADLLTLSKIAVYPVGAEGVITEHPMEASNAGPTNTEGATADTRMGGSTSQRHADPMTPYADEHAARAAKIAAMEQLAADTGGQAILNANDLNKAIARAVQNGSHYYTLVYTPTDKEMDGKYRRIEIKMNGAKYKLSYRRGYYADAAARGSASSLDSSDTATTDADPLRHLLARGMPSATQLLFGVRVLPATPQPSPTAPHAGGNSDLTGPLTRYSVDFLIRWTDVDLQLTPQGNHAGKLQLGVIAYGHDGKPVNWVGVSQIMNINPATFAAIQKSGIPAHLEIDLPRQDVYLATGVYDWASKNAGTLEIPLNTLRAQGSTAGSK